MTARSLGEAGSSVWLAKIQPKFFMYTGMERATTVAEDLKCWSVAPGREKMDKKVSLKVQLPILKFMFCRPKKNGNQTFTHEGRLEGAAKLKESRSGWPQVTKGVFDERMLAAGRRFDEPGMEIVEKNQIKLNRIIPRGYHG